MAEWLPNATRDHLVCRSLGHSWTIEALNVDREAGVYLRLTRCDRCACSKTDRLDYDFRNVGRTYAYPEGYQTGKDQHAVKRHEATGELFRRVKVRLPGKRKAA